MRQTRCALVTGVQTCALPILRHLLRARMHESPALGDIAAELHLTERTLRRQLLAAGSGFRILHDEVRSERARELLRGSDLPIAQVGASVGFRDAREFRRARSEEHTSELQSLMRISYAVFCLKKTKQQNH